MEVFRDSMFSSLNSPRKRSVFYLVVLTLMMCNVIPRVSSLSDKLIETKLEPKETTQPSYGYKSVSISGNHAIVGVSDKNMAYLYSFKEEESKWVEEKKLFPSSVSSDDDLFGFSVSISGDYAIVGNSHYQVGGDVIGAAFIFERGSENIWEEKQKLLTEQDTVQGDFGVSVSIHENYAAVGDSGSNKNEVSIFCRNDTGYWELERVIKIEQDIMFGRSVCLHDNILIVGAIFYGGNNVGSAYVYENNGTDWEMINMLEPNQDDRSYFGKSVSVYGEYAAIGYQNQNADNGTISIFKRGITSWEEHSSLKQPGKHFGNGFGSDIDISGDFLVAGDYSSQDRGFDTGSAYVYKLRNDQWIYEAKILSDDALPNSWFGQGVAIDGHKILISETNPIKSQSGAAYIYNFVCSEVKECSYGECKELQCECDSGRKKEEPWNCTQYSCEGLLECNGNGLCVGVNECECFSGWKGSDCSEFACQNDCNNHGVCIGNNVCNCITGYRANNLCSNYSCDASVDCRGNNCTSECNGNGKCIGANICECFSGWIKFDPYQCNGHTCENLKDCSYPQGKCTSNNTCTCENGFGGAACEINTIGITLGIVLPIGFIVTGIVIIIFVVIAIFVVLQKKRLSRYTRHKEELDVVLQELELEDEDSKKFNIKIDKSIFMIERKEISIVKRIGEGGSGSTVYRAVWKNNIVAFKQWRLSDFSQEEQFQNFETESLKHPGVVECYGTTIEPPIVGLLMRFCERGDVTNYITTSEKNGQKLKLKERLRILKEISSAMEYIHEKNIIHRDLKPENVLITETRECKVTDFGISRTEDQEKTMTMRVGTNEFMAPELILGTRYDRRVDVFSFSILAYIIVTSNFDPYGEISTNESSIFSRVANDPNFRPNLLDITNDTLRKLIRNCWLADQNKRLDFKSIFLVLKDLHEKANESLTIYLKKEGQDDSDANDVEMSDRTVKNLRDLVYRELGAYPVSIRLRNITILNDSELDQVKDGDVFTCVIGKGDYVKDLVDTIEQLESKTKILEIKIGELEEKE